MCSGKEKSLVPAGDLSSNPRKSSPWPGHYTVYGYIREVLLF